MKLYDRDIFGIWIISLFIKVHFKFVTFIFYHKLIISKNYTCNFEQCFVFKTIQDAIVYAAQQNQNELYVVGGGEIYKQILPLTHTIHLTLVHTTIDGDTFFEYDDSNWTVTHTEFISKDEKNEFDSTYIILERAPTKSAPYAIM